MKLKLNWDAIGITTSLACAIHCAVLPLLLSSLPILGINIIDNPGFEYSMIGLAFAIGTGTLYHGYRKHHHRLLPMGLFCTGMVLLLGKQLWHEAHLFLLFPAVIAIISAHFLNFRLCRAHDHAHEEDCNH
ncbi:MAG: MerC domain-containing protein [Bacteroidetes bacterium]|nr:MerC domain-containing protein [Bacteroidota bacterium]